MHRRFSKLLAPALAGAALVAGLVAPASAASAAPTWVSQATSTTRTTAVPLPANYASLPASQQKFVVGSVTSTVTTTPVSPAQVAAKMGANAVPASASGCSTGSNYIQAQSPAHTRIWQYSIFLYWCWGGGKITRIGSPATSGSLFNGADIAGWDYGGNVSGPTLTNHGWFYETYAQGKFEFCPPRVICVQRVYPWLTLNDVYDGSWSGNSGT